MTLEEVKAALAPFAKFAEVFTHNMLGVDYDQFYKKTATVNGQDREFILRGADFDRAKDAFDFLAGIDPSKQPQAGPKHDPNVPVVELKEATETTTVADTATVEEKPPADAPAIHETKQEPMPAATEAATAKKGKGK